MGPEQALAPFQRPEEIGLNILLVTAEAAPLAKVGGLADVAGALPRELAALGHDARLVMPAYPMIEKEPRYRLETDLARFYVPLGSGRREAYARRTEVGGVPVHLIGGRHYFQEATESSKIYVPGAEPYIFFCRGVIELVRNLAPKWRPDVIHCNDWHTGLIPAYLRTLYGGDPVLAHVASVFTIHNLAYQGEFDNNVLEIAGLPAELYSPDGLECSGKVNFMKAGIVFSDLVNTVSETYACEIETPEFGCRLDGVLQDLCSQGRLRGILNGLDYHDFNPMTDRHIRHNYGPGDVSGKRRNKVDLQNELGLPEDPDIPVFGMVSRLVEQKGLDLIKAVMPRLMKLDVQFVLLGTGDPAYEAYFESVQKRNRLKMRARIGFDPTLAQKIYAGCDIFLMPSRFEPCGLGQMISLRYGTVPVVRATGGLADTVREFDPADLYGNGFVFTRYEPEALVAAIRRALSIYQSQKLWQALVENGMACDFSLRRSALEYEQYYLDAIGLARSRAAA